MNNSEMMDFWKWFMDKERENLRKHVTESVAWEIWSAAIESKRVTT